MSKLELSTLGAQQRRVVEILWERDGATVHEVLEEINATSDAAPLAYTTVLGMMQKLEKAGWLEHEKSEEKLRAYVYRVTISRNEAIGKSLCSFAETFLQGSKTLLFQHFVEDTDLSEKELDEIRKMIQKRKGNKS